MKGSNSKIRRNALQNSTKHNIGYSSVNEHQQSISKFESNHSVNLWQQAESITQMIDLLQEYEKSCQKQMDLPSAE